MNKTSFSLDLSKTMQLTATVNPSTALRTVIWTSSNSKVATVDANGLVTAVGNGTATITVTTKIGSKTANATVTVSTPVTPVSNVLIDKRTVTLKPTETSQLTATLYPSNASSKDVTWSSSNTAVARVSASGLVTAVANGTATITVTTKNGNKTDTATITVRSTEISVDSVKLDNSSMVLSATQTAQLMATISPANASNQNVTWSSNSKAVATVDSNGLVTAVGNGTAIITAKTQSGLKTASVTVTVSSSVVSVTLNQTQVALSSPQVSVFDEDTTYQLTATVYPSTVSNKNVTWSSSNTAVAKVSSSGLVTAVASGTATITATTQSGAKTATASVVVTKLLGGVWRYYPGDINYVIPSDSVYTTSDKNVAYIDMKGDLITVRPGITTLRILEAGKTSDVMLIWVRISPEHLDPLQFKLGDTYQLQNKVPAGELGAGQNVTWTSSNDKVVTVDSSGLLKARGTGSAVLSKLTPNVIKRAIYYVVVAK